MYKMPERQETLKYFKQWGLYEEKLKSYGKTKLYVSELLKMWITKIPNPLEIPVVLNLISREPEEFEIKLINFEHHIGGKNLKTYLDELNGIMQPDQIWQKIRSLDFEIIVYDELIKNSKYINKIESIGDWETEEKIISVKSILDLDFNYQLIENLLMSFFYIKEYKIIRKYNSVRLKISEDFDYKFRNTVLFYLRNNIIDILQTHNLMYLQYPEFGETKNYNLAELKISVNTVVDSNKCKTINIHISSNSNIASEINIEFKENVNKCCFSIMYDTNTFWISASNFNEIYVLNRIVNYVKEIEKKFESYKFSKSFEGWIVLPIHAKDEEFFLNDKKSFEDKLTKIRTKKAFKIYLFIHPQHGFDLINKLLIEI